jgi:putative component of toxin-antitoxin plasmid stabilization module
MSDMRDLQAIADKLERAMEQLRLVRFGDISAVGYGLVLDARCLLAEAQGQLDSMRKQKAA